MDSSDSFRNKVKAQHPLAFRLHRDTTALLEKALATPRGHPGAVEIALDMLMLQAYKAHSSVRLLAEYAHIEDAATITRRVLELAVQAVYIGGDSDEPVRSQRGSRYVADLWDRLSSVSKARMPTDIKSTWQAIHDSIGPLSPTRPRWDRPFRQMFEYAGLADTYTQDYTFLSSLAHGSSEEQILVFSQPTVDVRPTHQVGMLLVFASRYYLAVAEMWNRAFTLVGEAQLSSLTQQLKAWKPEING